ncbi:hypothetical protein Efla_006387 [Eimeria flavescens]
MLLGFLCQLPNWKISSAAGPQLPAAAAAAVANVGILLLFYCHSILQTFLCQAIPNKTCSCGRRSLRLARASLPGLSAAAAAAARGAAAACCSSSKRSSSSSRWDLVGRMAKALKKGGKKRGVAGKGTKGAPGAPLRSSPLGAPPLAGALSLKRKAKTHKGRRIQAAREAESYPKVKSLLLLRGARCSSVLQQLLADLRDMKKPDAVYLCQRKQQDLHAFENAEPIEYLATKNGCGVFAFGSSSKKRPCRLLLGRVYEGQLLDMHEFAVSHFTPAAAFAGVQAPHAGSTPLVLLQGGLWVASERMQTLKNLFADLFRGIAAPPEGPPQQLFLSGLDRVIAISAVQAEAAAPAAAAGAAAAAPAEADGSEADDPQQTHVSAAAAAGAKAAGGDHGVLICIRQYRLVLLRPEAGSSGGGGPPVKLEEVGPQIDLKLDRVRLPAADRWRSATKTLEKARAEEAKARRAAADAEGGSQGAVQGAPTVQGGPPKKKSKNISTNIFGDSVGRVFVEKPDLARLKQIQSPMLRKMQKTEAKQKKAAAAAADAARQGDTE